MVADVRELALGELGNVPATYAHEWRVGEFKEILALPGALFKWYHVRREGVPVPDALDAAARATLAEALAGGAWTPEYGLNFAMLHQSTGYAYLLAGVWRGHQELWLRVYYKNLATDEPFRRLDPGGEDWPAGCAWEFGVTCHERLAWHRYLFSARTDADKRAWLADVFNGQV